MTKVAAAVLSLSLLAGCSYNKSEPTKNTATSGAAMGIVNSKCPYSDGPVDSKITRDFGGAKIGFCCNGCAGKFDKSSDAAKQEILANAKK